MGSAVIPPPPGFELDDEFVPPPPGFELDSLQPPVAPIPVRPPAAPRVADPFSPEQSWVREQAATKRPSFQSPVKNPSPVVQDRPGPEAVRPMAPTSIPPTVETTPVGRANAPVPGRIPGMERLGGAAPGVPPVTNPMRPAPPPVRMTPPPAAGPGPQIQAEEVLPPPSANISLSRSGPVPPAREGLPRTFGEGIYRAAEYSAEQIPKVLGSIPKVNAMMRPGQTQVTPEEALQSAQVVKEPLVRPDLLVPGDDNRQDLTREIARGALEAVGGLTSPEMIGVVAATGGLGKVAQVATNPATAAALRTATTGLSLYFTGSAAVGGYQAGKTAMELYDKGDAEGAARYLGLASVDLLFAAIGTAHAVKEAKSGVESFKGGYERGQRRRAAVEDDAAGRFEQAQQKFNSENMEPVPGEPGKFRLKQNQPEPEPTAETPTPVEQSIAVRPKESLDPGSRAPNSPQAVPPTAPTPTPAESPAPAPPQQAEVPAQVPPPQPSLEQGIPEGERQAAVDNRASELGGRRDRLAQERYGKAFNDLQIFEKIDVDNSLFGALSVTKSPPPPPPAGFTVDPLPGAIESAPDAAPIPSSEASEMPAPVKQDGPAWAMDVQPTENINGVWTEHPSTRAIIASAEQELIDRGRITREDIPALRRQAGDKLENGAQHGEAYARVLQAYLQGAMPKLDQPAPVPAPGPREEVVQPVPVDAAAPVAAVQSEQEPDAPLSPEVAAPPSAVEAAAPEAQPPAAPKEPPAGVAASVKRYLETISDVNRQLAEARTVDDKFGGEGRYENEVWDRLMGEDGAVTAEANKKLQVFRELAVKNGVDADAFIDKMGGMPELPALSERAKKYRGESIPPALESPGERSEAEAAVDRIVGDRAGSVTAVDDLIDAYFSDPRKVVLDEIKKRLTDLQYNQVAFDELTNEQQVAIGFIMANKVTDDADLPTVRIRRSGDPFSTPTIPVEQRGEAYDDRKFAIKRRIRKGEVPTNKDMAFLSDVDRAYMVKFGEAEGVVIPPRAGKAKKPAAVVEEPVAPPAPEQPKDFQWNGPVPNFENFKGRQANPAPDAPPPADSRIVYGRRAPAKTARGYKVETNFAVVPMASLRISNSDNGEVNPNYPGELQPRQRDRKSSDEQIQEIIAQFDPDQLAENYLATDGAPIIGDDLAVESGNGRSMALRRIYERFPQKAKLYQDWLVENADRFGIDPEALAGIENPVLVRVRKTLPKGVSRTDFGRDANERTTGGMSPAEQAAIDARGLDPEIMRLFQPSEDGKINTMANAPFVRAFFASIVPGPDRQTLRDGEGNINPAGIKRIENAIFAKAYGDRGMIEKMAEDPDDNIKSVVGAMISAANRFISMRNAIESGDLHPRDISADLTAAAKVLSNLRFEGKSIDDYLNQVDMFGRPKVQDAIMATLRDLGRSKAKFLDILNRYVDTVEAAGNPKQDGMFGPAEPPPPPLAIWSSIIERAQVDGQGSQDAAPQGGLDASRPESGDGSGKSPAKKGRRAEGEQSQPGRPADSGRAGNTVERTKDGLQETLVTDMEARESQIAAKNDSNRPLVDMPFSLSAPEAPAPTGPDPRQDSMFGGEDSKADYKARIIGTRIENWNANKYGIQSRYPLITSNEQWAKFVNDYADAYIKDDRAGSIIDYYNSKVAGINRGGWNDSEVVGYAPGGTLGAKPPSNGGRGKKATPPTGPRTGTAVSRSEIVKNLSSFLNNIPIRTGGFRERAAGIFKVRQNVIRTAKALDLETISHEIGHAIHKYLWGTRKGSLVALNLKPLRPFQNELGLLDYDQNKQRAYEGFAEYIRLRITKPAEAKQRAPRFHTWFNQKLSEAPELADVLKKAQEQYSNWDIQPSTVKLAKSIDTKPNHESFIKRVTDGMSDFRYNWIDDKTGLRDAVELFKRLGADVSDALNAYLLARTLSGTFTRANFAITNKTVGADNAPNGAGLGEILKPIADRDVSERNPAFQKLVDDWGINLADDGMDDFRVYIVARRLLDYRDKGLETGFTLQELKRAVADTETPAVKAAAEELHEYSGRILDYAFEKGAMTEDTREAIRSKNEFYVPLHRVMDNVSAEDAKAMLGRKMLDLNSPVLKRKGSTREIIDPLESVIKNTYAIMSFADRNAVAQALVKQAERVSDQGYLVESGIVNPMKATTFNLKEVGKDIMAALEEAGIDGSELELDHMSTIFRPNMDPRRSNGVVRVIVDGIPKLYQMDKNLIRALDNTDAQSADLFKKMAANAAASLRFGATAGNPEFILTNFFRDQGIAGIQSRNGYLPIISGMWGAFKMLSDPKAFQEWQLAGGATAAMMPLTRKNLRLTVDKVTKSKKDLVLSHPAQIFPLLRDALTFFGEKSEASTRFAEYLLAKGKGKSTAEAAFDSRDVSLDFERMGKIAKTVNQFVPFFSVALNAGERFVQAHNPRNKKQFAQSMAKGLLGITIPTMMLWLLNKDDEEYKNVEAWKRDLFWLIPTKYFEPYVPEIFGVTAREAAGPFIRIPKPPMWGQLYGSFFERLADSLYNHNKHAFDDFEKTAFQTLLPPASVQAIKPIEEVMSNYNAFTDRPIETEFMKKLSPENRYTPTTSELSKGMSKVIGGSLSPVQVEHLLLGYTAGLGRVAITGGEELAGLRKDRPAMEASERPFVRAFATPSSPYLSTNFKLFKERLEKLKQKREDFKFSKDPKYRMTSAEETKLSKLEDINERVNEIRSKQFKVYGSKTLSRDEKRRKLDMMNQQRDEILKRTKPLYD